MKAGPSSVIATCLLAGILSAAAYVVPSSENGVGSPCRLPSGGRGACRLITDCPPALAAVRHGTRRGTHGTLARCGFQGNLEIVCCDSRGGVRRHDGGRRTGPPRGRPSDTEWLNSSSDQRNNIQTLTERKSVLACRYYRTRCPKTVSPYIIMGTEAEKGEFPHMAVLGFAAEERGQNISWNCGGTLISDRYVMTAAHCTSLDNRKPIVVRLGELNLSTDEDEVIPVDFAIEQVYIHPLYKSNTRYHDIALIRLNKVVEFTVNICPACLYTGKSSILATSGGDRNDLTERVLADGEEIGQRIDDVADLSERTLIVSGWGTTTYLGDKSAELLKAFLKPYSIGDCNRTLTLATGRSSNHLIPQGLIPSAMLCAGDPQGKQDTCQGDSGGPLQFRIKDSSIYTVVGITSLGEKCGYSLPAMYTRVSSYLDWIEGKVWPGTPTFLRSQRVQLQ